MVKTIFAVCALLLVSLTVIAKPFRVVSEHLPPHQISYNGKFIGGTSYLIMKEVLRRAGFPERMEVLPWARAYKTAQEEDNVIIFSLARSAKREKLFKWIGKLEDIEFNFYALRTSNGPSLNTFEDALQYNTVTVRNSISSEILQRLGFVEGHNLTLTVGIIDAWNMLRKGRTNFTYTNNTIAQNMYSNFGMKADAFVKQSVSSEKQAVFVAASLGTDDCVINKLSDVLKQLKQDGTYETILAIQHPAVK
jgi:polar amino acid transport system substrate-binding protein